LYFNNKILLINQFLVVFKSEIPIRSLVWCSVYFPTSSITNPEQGEGSNMTGTAATTPPGLLFLIYGRQITDILKKSCPRCIPVKLFGNYTVIFLV